MSHSTMPGMKMHTTEAFDELARTYEAMLPKQYGGAMNLFVHPMAGAAAFSALGFGVASHALGMWMGTVAGAAEASRRMLEGVSEAGSPEKPARKVGPSKARLELVASSGVPEADAAMRTAAAEAERLSDKVAETARAIAEDAGREAEATVRAANRLMEAAVGAGETETAATSKPKGIERPDAVDDLKAISGIGPKLEQVLNGFGIWTYGQIAELSEAEIAWLDEELGFSGRIGRDAWIGQAKRLAGRG